MKGKPLSLFGLESSLKVVDVRPTNIPIVRARELRMDNLFELEDGSVAIIDYESEYRETNFTKYGRYIMDVIDRYLREEKEPDIHMIVLYTADVEYARASLVRTACRIQTGSRRALPSRGFFLLRIKSLMKQRNVILRRCWE